ncbi:hypothetical protein [Bellilinea sp.]|uniref:hypothetical protein n=1 Tax=Bellilinea sp. TaxID=2838785 RepID=UPI002ADD81BC|nr:hypothetical protein [Bellilinea sp.]
MDLWAIATLAAVLMLGAILTLYNSRQAQALREMEQVLSDWYLMQVAERREKQRQAVKVDDPLVWLGQQIDLTLTGVERQQEAAQAVSFLTDNATRLVVSPFSPDRLKRVLKPLEARNGKVANLVDPLLGRNPGKVQVEERSILNAGEWFDVEAGLVGQALGINWGEPKRLYFYRVPLAEKK